MVGRKWIQVRFLGWQGVQWLSFQKLALYFSSACHLQGTEGGHCLSLSCYTKEDASWRVERGAASLAKSRRKPEWSYLQGVLPLIPVGGGKESLAATTAASSQLSPVLSWLQEQKQEALWRWELNWPHASLNNAKMDDEWVFWKRNKHHDLYSWWINPRGTSGMGT